MNESRPISCPMHRCGSAGLHVQSIQRRSHCNYVRVCVAVCCSVLYKVYSGEATATMCVCAAVCCSLLQRVAVYCTKYTAEKSLQLCACVCCSVLQLVVS